MSLHGHYPAQDRYPRGASSWGGENDLELVVTVAQPCEDVENP